MSDQNMFDVVKLQNPLDVDFIHEFAGKKFKIKANSTVDLPFAVAKDTAYYIAQKILLKEGLPFFGQEHEDKINELIGKTPNPMDLIPDDLLIDDVETMDFSEKPKLNDIQELESTPMPFTPAENGIVDDGVMEQGEEEIEVEETETETETEQGEEEIEKVTTKKKK